MANNQNRKNVQRPVAPQPRPAQAKPAAPKQNEPKKGLSFTLKLALLLGIIAFAVYANTLKNDYALDDFNVIRENTIVSQGISAIPRIVATPYRLGWFVTTNDLYRPLSLAMFATEYQVFDKSAAALHFFNILWFAGCVMLLFYFVHGFFDRKKPAVAFITALLFALHPIHTEVVANIKSRDEIMCFFFAFLSLNIFLRYAREGKTSQLLLGCMSFFLSLMSKETVITFLAVIPVIFYFYRNEDKARSLRISLGALAMAGLFLGIRYSVLSAYGANTTSEVSFIDNMLSAPPSAGEGFATKLVILGHYLRMLFIPYPLICDYSYNSIPFVSLGNIWALLSLAIYIALAAFGIHRLFKGQKDPFAFTIIYYLATIALFSNILILIGSPMAERFAFFSSVAFCLAVGIAIDRWILKGEASMDAIKKPAVMGILAPICLVYAGLTFTRNFDWVNNYTLFKADIDKRPNDSRLAYYLGTETATSVADKAAEEFQKANAADKDVVAKANEIRKQKVLEGIQILYKSLAVYPNYSSAHSSIGNAYFKIQMNDSAEVHDRRALELNPNDAVTINNLAGVYFTSHKYHNAIDLCHRALELNPKYVNAWSNIGLCYLHLGKADSSLMALYTAMSVDPTFTGTYDNFVLVFKAMNQPDSVKKYDALAKQKPF